VIDFGLSEKIGSKGAAKFAEAEDVTPALAAGKAAYMAPEWYTSQKRGFDGASADMWSCGRTLLELLRTPAQKLWSKAAGHDMRYTMLFSAQFTAGGPSADFGLPQLSEETRALARRLLAIDPTERITASNLKKKFTQVWLFAPEANEAEGKPAGKLPGSFTADARQQVKVAIALKEGVPEDILSLQEDGEGPDGPFAEDYCALLDNFIIDLVREARPEEYRAFWRSHPRRRDVSRKKRPTLFMMKGAKREAIGDLNTEVDRETLAWAMEQYEQFDSTWPLDEKAATMFAGQLSLFDYRTEEEKKKSSYFFSS
jgi:serine/threonine protein kinase